MSENEFLNALKEEMPESFGRDLLAQLKTEEKKKVKSFPAVWTVAAASIITVLVGFVLFFSRMSNNAPLSLALQDHQAYEQLGAENIDLVEPLLTIGSGHAQAITLSPDGNTFAVGTSMGIYLHDATDLAAEPIFLDLPNDIYPDLTNPYEGIIHLEYTDDGRLFVMVKDFFNVRLYEWDAIEQIYHTRFSSERSWLTIQIVDVSPDGSKLFYGLCSTSTTYFGACEANYAPQLLVIDLATGRNLYFDAPQGVSNAIAAMSPDWTAILFQENNGIHLRNLATGDTETLLAIDNVQIQSGWVWNEMHRLYFSLDGSQIGIKGSIGSAMDWWAIEDLRNREEVLLVPAYGSEAAFHGPDVVALNPLNDEYVLSSNRGLTINDYDDEILGITLSMRTRPIQLVVHPVNQNIYGLDATGLIRVWDWANLFDVDITWQYALNNASDFSFSADSQVFTATHNDWQSSIGFVWDISTTRVEELPLPTRYLNEYPRVGINVVSHDGRYTVFTQDHTIWLFDREQQTSHVLAVTPISYIPLSFAFREDGTLIMLTNETGHGEHVSFSPEILASGEPVYELESHALPVTSDAMNEEPINFLFSPDGSMLASFYCPRIDVMMPICEDSYTLRLFDTNTWEEIADFENAFDSDEANGFFNIFFSADSRWFGMAYCTAFNQASSYGCEDDAKVIDLWDTRQMTASPNLRIDHLPVDIWQYDLLPRPDGSFLLFGVPQLTIGTLPRQTIFWHVQPNGEKEELRRMSVNAVSFSPDGSYFLSSQGGVIELWGVPASVASSD